MSTPPTFQAGGRSWSLALTLGTLRRVRNAGHDLLALDAGDPPLAVRLRTDPLLVGEILWQILEPQITAAGMSETAFCESLTARDLAAAHAALCAALLDFFRHLGRPDLAASLDRTGALIALLTARTAETVNKTDLQALANPTTPGNSSHGPPRSPASTPGPGPGENSRPPPTPQPERNGHKRPSSPH
jgi:hypothetical protein